ncbi:hypothetical protein Tco_0263591, partial [Tanacetum coccineum]
TQAVNLLLGASFSSTVKPRDDAEVLDSVHDADNDMLY